MKSPLPRWVLFWTLLALGLRLAFVLAVERDSFVLNDSFFYGLTAKSLAEGDGFSFVGGQPTAQWPPGFPAVMSLLFRVVGSHELAGEVLNAVIGALTVPALYLLVRKAFGAREGLMAAGILAVFPGQILWTDVLVAETLYAFLLVCFFLLLAGVAPRARGALAVGAAIGVITLTRGEGVLLIPVALAVWWPSLPRRTLIARTALVAAGVALVILPWTVRNAVEMDAFIPLSTNSSTTLWSGHNAGATGGQSYASQDLTGRGGGKRREVEEGRVLRRQALEFMVTHPRRELELVPLKLLNLNRGDSWAMEWVNAGKPGERPFEKELGTPVRVLADASYYALFALTAASVLLFWRSLWRNPVARGVLVLFAGSLFLFGFIYYGNYRYRVPLEPLMILIAAPLLARLKTVRS